MTSRDCSLPGGQGVALRFYRDAARPIIEGYLAGTGYLAGRLGSGSDVLGFDTGRSHDHDFGCRLTVLVNDEDGDLVPGLISTLEAELPAEVDGWPTRFATTWDETVSHKVDVHTVSDFVESRLGVSPRSAFTAIEWLCLTGQSVLEVVAGPVFHDNTEAYTGIRQLLDWYPDDVWLYTLAAGWSRLSQELPFVGRAGELGDEVGSAIIASRLCRDIVHLAFLIERTWMPYPKWQGTAMDRLDCGSKLKLELAAVQQAVEWPERQQSLATALETLAEQHGNAGLTLPDPVIQPFYGRPAIISNEAIPSFLLDRIKDPAVRALPPIGSIEQWCDNVDVLTQPARRLASGPAMYSR